MSSAFCISLAVAQPLFGSIWLALLAVSLAIAVLLSLVAGLGRWLAATHPVPPPKIVATTVALTSGPNASEQPPVISLAAPAVFGDIAPEVVPVIIGAVADWLGPRARVTSIRYPCPTTIVQPSIEALMQR
jgi:hypothetical protein